jgi:hypothetical protein
MPLKWEQQTKKTQPNLYAHSFSIHITHLYLANIFLPVQQYISRFCIVAKSFRCVSSSLFPLVPPTPLHFYNVELCPRRSTTSDGIISCNFPDGFHNPAFSKRSFFACLPTIQLLCIITACSLPG